MRVQVKTMFVGPEGTFDAGDWMECSEARYRELLSIDVVRPVVEYKKKVIVAEQVKSGVSSPPARASRKKMSKKSARKKSKP